MKKGLLMMAVMLTCLVSYGQTEKGGWLLGASSNLGFRQIDDSQSTDKATAFQLDVKGGNFLMDNLAVGLSLDWSHGKQGDFKSTTTAIGPFARYYVNGMFYVGASYMALNSKSTNNGVEFKADGSIWGVEAGYPIWLVDTVAIEPALEYSSQSVEGRDVTSFGLAVGISIYF